MDALRGFRVEVIALVLHFLITIGILGGYLYTVSIHQPDETLKNLLLLIGGYWFGIMGLGKTFGKKESKSPDKQ